MGQKLSVAIATFFYSGLLPRAPGTWGSLAALLGYIVFLEPLSWQTQVLWILGCTLLGVYSIAKVQKKMGQHDDGRFVIDEVSGMWITVCGCSLEWFWLGLGFLLFRLLDIFKPFPSRYFDETFHGGWGVMLDDVICGIYALAILKVMKALMVFV